MCLLVRDRVCLCVCALIQASRAKHTLKNPHAEFKRVLTQCVCGGVCVRVQARVCVNMTCAEND